MVEPAVVMANFPIQPVHKIQYPLLNGLPVRQLHKVGVELGRSGLAKLLPCHVKFLNRVLSGIFSEENIKELTLPDDTVVLLLFPLPVHRVAEILTKIQFKIEPLFDVDIV